MSETSLASQVAEQSAELMALRNEERWKRAKIKEQAARIKVLEKRVEYLEEVVPVTNCLHCEAANARIKELEAELSKERHTHRFSDGKEGRHTQGGPIPTTELRLDNHEQRIRANGQRLYGVEEQLRNIGEATQ